MRSAWLTIRRLAHSTSSSSSPVPFHQVWKSKGVMDASFVNYVEKSLEGGGSGVKAVGSIAEQVYNNDKSLAFFCAWHAARRGDSQSAYILSQLFLHEEVVDPVEQQEIDAADAARDAKAREVIQDIKEKTKAQQRKNLNIELSDVKRRVSKDGLFVKLSPVEKPRVDTEESLRWLKVAAKGGVVEAMMKLANQIVQDEACTLTDLKEAIELYEKAASSPEPLADAMYNLGSLYYEGHGGGLIPPNPRESIKWFTKAVEHNDYSAMYLLGHLYRVGYPEGALPVNGERSVALLRRAAVEGKHSSACFYLGKLLVNGDEDSGTIKDEGEGRKLILQAADLGDEEALYYLGAEAFETKDYNGALKLWQRAGAEGSAEGWCNAGALLYKGCESFPPNAKEAFVAYQNAVELGSVDALRNLASMHAKGEGTPVDLKTAKYLLNFATKLEAGDK